MKSIRPGFFTVAKDIHVDLQKLKKTAVETLLFCVENVIHILLDAMNCDNFGRFYGRKFKKITNKAIEAEKISFIFIS